MSKSISSKNGLVVMHLGQVKKRTPILFLHVFIASLFFSILVKLHISYLFLIWDKKILTKKRKLG